MRNSKWPSMYRGECPIGNGTNNVTSFYAWKAFNSFNFSLISEARNAISQRIKKWISNSSLISLSLDGYRCKSHIPLFSIEIWGYCPFIRFCNVVSSLILCWSKPQLVFLFIEFIKLFLPNIQLKSVRTVVVTWKMFKVK